MMAKDIRSMAERFAEVTEIRKLAHLLDRLWVRILAIAFLSFVAIGVARLSAPLFPPGFKDVIGAESVNRLLEIIANSMLAVTTFSLTVMVSVFRSASSQWTPRVHRLMLEDQTTQNTLATLIGAYIYALSSIILLETKVFQDDQVVVLFGFTLLILVMIVVSIVRWVVHLQTLGSLIETTRRIEDATTTAFRKRMELPCLGGHVLEDFDDIPDDAVPFAAQATGYVQHMFEGQLNETAEEEDIDIYLVVTIGEFVYRGQPIAYMTRESDKMKKTLTGNVVIGDLRTFEQDPRFGLVVLGEIASKALSPGINDPGTAIDAITRLSRVFESYPSERDRASEDMPYPRLWMAPLEPGDLIEDGFDPIARDGAGVIEVQLALQNALKRLAEHPDGDLAKAAKEAAKRAFDRTKSAMTYENDLKRLQDVTPADVQDNAKG